MKFTSFKNWINEITRAEDDWANAQIDKWRESQESSNSNLKEYNQKIVDYIWKRLKEKISPIQLRYTDTTKDTIDKLINMYDEPDAFYMGVTDYWEENIPWEEAANSLFDECLRQISAQGWAM